MNINTSTTTIILAMRDPDVRDRLVATAIKLGIPEAESWVNLHLNQLIVAPVVADGSSTFASVYEYAVRTWQEKLRPGADPAAVTDDHLLHAVETVLASERAQD